MLQEMPNRALSFEKIWTTAASLRIARLATWRAWD
jgi:hypothetical protein